MSIWSRIADAISSLTAGEGLSAVFEKLRTPPERTVGFTIAVIALGAKMAKADGQVTRDEVSAFREVFSIPPNAEKQAAKVFNLARQDVAGYDVYATRIAGMFGEGHGTLCFLMEGLFHIALADGEYHPNENEFLEHVADIFGLSTARFQSLRTRFVPDAAPDPYTVLGVSPDAPIDDIKARWRRMVIDLHPDRVIAEGLPEEAVKIAEARLQAVNTAWEEIRDAEREPEPV